MKCASIKHSYRIGRGPGQQRSLPVTDWASRVTDGHATWKHTCKTRRGGECWRKKREREERRKDMKIELKMGSQSECGCHDRKEQRDSRLDGT